MTPRYSIIGQITNSRFLRRFHWRALILGGASAILMGLAFFPERYLATSSFTPSDRDALGLSGALGQLGAIQSVFGNQAAVEVALRIGNSEAVRDDVIAGTHLGNRFPGEGRVGLQRYLREKVSIRSLRGGIILIEMQDRNATLAKEVVTAFQSAISTELGEVSRRQTAYKRDMLLRLVRDASQELQTAQSAFDTFRLTNRYPEPRSAIAAIGSRVELLEVTIRAREIQLATARQVFTDENITVRQMRAEIAALQRQLQEARAVSPQQSQGVGELVQNSTEFQRLERELVIAQALYDNYMRYLRGTAVEDLAADANLRVLEQPYVSTERQMWMPAFALSIAILLIWLAIEAYRFRPPPRGLSEETADA